MDSRERLCLFCTEFNWEQGDHHFSEMTPGSNAHMDCNKHIWEACLNEICIESFREIMLTAGTCGHYNCVDWEKKDGNE